MKKMILIATSVILASWAIAQTTEEMMAEHIASRKVILLEVTQEDGTHLKYETTEKAVSKTPEWDGTAEPPKKVTGPDVPGRSETNVAINIKDQGQFSMTYSAHP